VLLRVVEPSECAAIREGQAVEIEQDRCRHERPGQGTAPGLVGAGDEAALESAVEGEQLAAARALLTACRCAWAASR
jgi:hypothetical protein